MTYDDKIRIPKANPIRITPDETIINYSTRFPNFDLMDQRTNYQRGVYNIEDYIVDFVVGRTLYFQFSFPVDPMSGLTVTLRNIDTSTSTPITMTDITPVGWVGFDVFQGAINIATQGRYYIYISIGNPIYKQFRSDVFYATGANATVKSIIDIKYRNTYNKSGMVWGANYYSTFFTGNFKSGQSLIENSISKEDDGVNIYSSKSFGALTLELCDIHETQLRQIEKIMMMDDLVVNGVPVTCENGIEKNYIDKTDVYNVNINLSLRYNDDYANFD